MVVGNGGEHFIHRYVLKMAVMNYFIRKLHSLCPHTIYGTDSKTLSKRNIADHCRNRPIHAVVIDSNYKMRFSEYIFDVCDHEKNALLRTQTGYG